ncbi:MAG TPA: IS110 family transposase [Acidimicrobiia bacterium]|nr:IS110 family transposase [Acidimicrobiia bacterium]
MIVIGVDSHKRTHTVVAVDPTGRKLAEKTVAAISAGHLELVRWAGRFEARTFALEDCRHLSRRLSTDLLGAGEAVVRVPPKLMAGARRSSREPGKSDPIDALAVARAALREDLPVATLDGAERDVRLLVDHREDLVAERTRAQNRLRWHLHELDPGSEPVARGLDRAVVLAALERDLAASAGTVGRIARELVVRIRELTATINQLEREIGRLIADLAPSLLALSGCGRLTAAKLVGETAGIGRFRSRAAFARHNGSAPLPVWSGNTERHRLSRTGNRQLNVALHRIAITQLQREGPGKTYLEHRRARGDTKTEAIRALRRRISDEVFRRMRHDEAARAAGPTGLAAAA